MSNIFVDNSQKIGWFRFIEYLIDLQISQEKSLLLGTNTVFV